MFRPLTFNIILIYSAKIDHLKKFFKCLFVFERQSEHGKSRERET